MGKFSITIELPTDIRMTVGKDGTLFNELKLDKLSPELLATAAINGFTSAWSDISRPKDDNGKAMDDASWKAARDKRSDAWAAGSWNQHGGGRSQSLLGAMSEQYIDERREATGATRAAIVAQMKATVVSTFGKDTNYTFKAFLEAVATIKSKAAKTVMADEYDAIVGALEARTQAALAEKAKVIPIDSLDLSALGF